MKLKWSDEASTDVDEIQRYIAQDNVEAALRVGELIEQAGERLRDYPLSGRAGAVSGTRELVVPRTRHLLVYRVVAELVVVLRVMGAGRRWPPETGE